MALIRSYSVKLLTLLLLTLAVTSAIAKPLPIWELQGTSNRVLLMGSVHFLRDSDYPLRDGMNAAYELADALIMEIDLSRLDPLAAQNTIAQLSMDPGGKSLRDLIGASSYNSASVKASELGVPLMMFDQFEPWFAALSITQLRMVQLGFDPSWGVEAKMTQRAAADGKPISGLETLEQQLRFMDDLDATTQKQFLLNSLDEAATVQNEVEEIVTAWRSGDSRSLEKSLLKGIKDAPGLYDALLVQRNRNWVQPIRDLANRSDNYLVIVGAMHLVGKDSVIEMLKDAGVKARQLDDQDFQEAPARKAAMAH